MTERTLRSTRSKQCRICLEQTDDHHMINPCDCKGSIEFVHRQCLKQYFVHRFKSANDVQRRKMKQQLKCQICKQQINSLRVKSRKRCVKCAQFRQQLQLEDVFFLIMFLLLYIGFHLVGIIIIIQNSLVARIIGSIWLLCTIIGFNFGLYKIIRKLCFVREPQITQITPLIL